MTKEKMTLEEFSPIYEKYFGKILEWKQGTEDKIRIKGLRGAPSTAMRPAALSQLAECFEYRMNRGHFAIDPLDEEECAYFDMRMELQSITKTVIAVISGFPYSTFSVKYDDCGNLFETVATLTLRQLDYVHSPFLTFEGVTKTYSEWAEVAGINTVQFKVRLKKLGLCKELFYTRAQFKELSKTNPLSRLSMDKSTIGSDEWRGLSSKNNPKRMDPKDVSKQSAENLIAHLIKDAKDDVKLNNKWAGDSERFLTNSTGHLEWILSAYPGIDAKGALSELRSFCRICRKEQQKTGKPQSKPYFTVDNSVHI